MLMTAWREKGSSGTQNDSSLDFPIPAKNTPKRIVVSHATLVVHGRTKKRWLLAALIGPAAEESAFFNLH